MSKAVLNLIPASSTPINSTVDGASSAQHMGAGSFFGAIHGKREQCGAIFTDLRHSSPRKLPLHSHELPFFALLLDGLYGERYLHRQSQYGPFTIMFRPAGIPHQDEIGPSGLRFFEIEIRPGWQKRLAGCSAALDTPHDDIGGGPLLWLGMKLFREMQNTSVPDELTVESLLALACFACRDQFFYWLRGSKPLHPFLPQPHRHDPRRLSLLVPCGVTPSPRPARQIQTGRSHGNSEIRKGPN